MLKIDTKFSQNNKTTLNFVAWVSFLWSTASLMVFSILPAFLVDELKMGHFHIGFIEGIAFSFSFLAKFFSGYLSDIFKDRKPLIMVGTVMSAITKPLFALCSGPYMMFGIRFTDRFSKGIRSAPTDALVADLSEPSLYASNFGLRQTLYTLGAVVGALLSMVIMLLSGNNYRLVFGLSFIPALLAILVLWFLVKPNPKTHPRCQSQFSLIKMDDLKNLSPTFWWLMVAFFFLMLARFSEAFLSLKAKEVGWVISFLPALVIIYDLVHAGVAWPAGKYADRISRNQMLIWGLATMIAAQMVLSYVTTVSGVLFGIVLNGLHMGITQGLLKAIVAQSTPAELRGTAFSIFFIISGFALFLGNAIAGHLSQKFGLYATFFAGGMFTLMAIIILYFAFMKQKPRIIELVKVNS